VSDFLDEEQRNKFAPGFRATSGGSLGMAVAGDPLATATAKGDAVAPNSPAGPGGPASPAGIPSVGAYDGPAYGVLTENSQLAGSNNPYVQQFIQRFGQTPSDWGRAEYQNEQLGGYVVGRGTPTFSGNGINEWGVDPSRVMYFDAAGKPTDAASEDGYFVLEGGNARGDAIAAMQSVDARQRQREVYQSSIPSALTGLPIGHGPLVEDMNRAAKIVGPAVAAYFLGPMAAGWLGAGEAAGTAASALGEYGASAAEGALAGGAAGAAGSSAAALGIEGALPAFLSGAGADLGMATDYAASIPGGLDVSAPLIEGAGGIPTLPTAAPAEALSSSDFFAAPVGSSIPSPTLVDPGVTIPAMPDINIASPSIGDRLTGYGGRLLDRALDNPLQTGLTVASLAGLAGRKPDASAADQLRDAAKPISAQAQSLLEQYGRGELNKADEFNINKWEHDQIARAQSLYARSGQGSDSSAAQAAIGKIQAQAQAMRDTALRGLLQAGLQASGMALGPLTQAIQMQAQQDQQFAQSTQQALSRCRRAREGNRCPISALRFPASAWPARIPCSRRSRSRETRRDCRAPRPRPISRHRVSGRMLRARLRRRP
jgi:hypothetical protein